MLYGTPGPARIGPPELSRFFELIKVEHLQSVIRIADQIPEPVNIKERFSNGLLASYIHHVDMKWRAHCCCAFVVSAKVADSRSYWRRSTLSTVSTLLAKVDTVYCIDPTGTSRSHSFWSWSCTSYECSRIFRFRIWYHHRWEVQSFPNENPRILCQLTDVIVEIFCCVSVLRVEETSALAAQL